MKAIFVSIFLFFFHIMFSQVDNFQKDIVDYLRINGTEQQYNNAYNSMFDVLKRNFEKAEVPDKVWVELHNDKEKSINEVLSLLSFAYRNHFSQEEILEMSSFYETESAQKLLTKEALSEKDNILINEFFTSDVAEKLADKRKDLSVDISEISTHWSRDLFAIKMEELIKNGYSPNE